MLRRHTGVDETPRRGAQTDKENETNQGLCGVCELGAADWGAVSNYLNLTHTFPGPLNPAMRLHSTDLSSQFNHRGSAGCELESFLFGATV